MKKIWKTLLPHHKKKFLLTMVILPVLIILLFLNPIDRAIDHETQRLDQNNKTLQQMTLIDEQLKALDAKEKPRDPILPQELWKTVQRYNLPTGLPPAGLTLGNQPNKVVVTSNGIKFDLLASWIVWLWQKHGITVTEADITALPTKGFVTVKRLTLSA